jgi:thiamine pyrophosphate-dependent acetolactate synthase large subunit-like protein
VLTTTNGKGTLPEDHPLALGARMSLPAARALLRDRDVVLAVGTELGESDIWGPPLELDGALVRLDIDAAQAHGNNAATVALIGDAAAGLAALAEALGDGTAADTDDVAAARARLEAEHAEQAAPWAPWMAALHAALDDDATVVGDNAMCCYNGAIGGLPVRRPRAFLFPTGFGTLGWSLPAAVGVALARPAHRTVAICGDGGLMFSLSELAAASALGLALPVVVFVNAGYGEIRKEMTAAGIDPLAVDIEPPDLAAAAQALGCAGAHAADPAALGGELAAAFGRRRPTVITVPEERP